MYTVYLCTRAKRAVEQFYEIFLINYTCIITNNNKSVVFNCSEVCSFCPDVLKLNPSPACVLPYSICDVSPLLVTFNRQRQAWCSCGLPSRRSSAAEQQTTCSTQQKQSCWCYGALALIEFGGRAMLMRATLCLACRPIQCMMTLCGHFLRLS